MDVTKAVTRAQGGPGRVPGREGGHRPRAIGKASFPTDKLVENVFAFMDTLHKLKPATAKGTYVKSITISTTHGPGIKIDPNSAVRVVGQ